MTERRTRKNSLRLQGYDYRSPGYYFVTILSFQRQEIFSKVIDKKVNLTNLGKIIQRHWLSIPTKKPGFDIDAFVIMPNHIHAIIRILNNPRIRKDDNSAVPFAKADSLSVLIRTFKGSVTKSVRKELGSAPPQIWHRSFNDHIIRDSEALDTIRFYIKSNPWRWDNERDIY